jgi:type IX secretion system substrate protein
MRFSSFLTTAFFLMTITTFTAKAQQTAFQMDYSFTGQDNVLAAIENSAGNFILAAESFNGPTGQDITLIEISPTGAVIQSQSIALPEHEFVRSIFETSDGHYILTGSIRVTSSDADWIILKFDASLNLIWYKTYGDANNGNDYANNGFEISPGHYAITGTVSQGGSAKPSIVTMDSSGTVLQEGYLTTNQFASPRYKGYYLGNGKIAYAQLSNSISIVDTLFNVIQNYAFAFGTYSVDIIQTNNGGYAITGIGSFGAPQGSKIFLALLDSNLASGAFKIDLGINGNNLSPVSVKQDSDGNFWVAGNGESLGAGTTTPIVIKIDSSGAVIWSNSYAPVGPVNPQINTMIETSDGGYLIAGQMSTALQRMFVAKLDSTGSSNCNVTPYPLTPQTNIAVPRTPHAPYTGAIATFTPSQPNVSAAVISENTICITTGLDPINNNNSGFTIYPTSVNEGFNVTFDLPSDDIQMHVYDLTGRLVFSQQIYNNEWVDCSELQTGTYFVKISNNQSEFVQTIIKSTK